MTSKRPTPAMRLAAGVCFGCWSLALGIPGIAIALRYHGTLGWKYVVGFLGLGLALSAGGMTLAGAVFGARILVAAPDEYDAFRIGAITGALAAAPAIVRAAIQLRLQLTSSLEVLPWVLLSVVLQLAPFAVVGAFAGWTLWHSKRRLGFERRLG